MSGPAAAAASPPDTEVPRQAWLALAVATIVVFFVVIDISAVNVAFPSIREDFEVSATDLSWIISAYNVVVAALLLLSGRLADSIGRRKVYLPGVAVFGIGSALCALAPSAGFLIAARIVQAIGGAIVTAAGFAVMLPDFPPARRSTAIGIAGAAGGLGAVAGPAIGSAIIDVWSWRGIFWINVPLCIIVLILGPRLLSESSDPDATGRIDMVGVAVGTAAVGALMFGIVQSESWGLADPRVIALIIVGLILVPIMLRRSRSHPEPVINMELFDFASFRSANLGILLYGLGFTSGFLTNSLMLQEVWDQPIRTVGAALVPAPLISAVVSPLIGRWADRYGHRIVLAVGCMMCALGYLIYVVLLSSTPQVWTIFVPFSLIVGVGVGFTVATWSSAGLSDIPPPRFGVAGATYNTLRQVAYGLGVSATITIIAVASTTAEIDATGIRWAWAFCVVCYALSAVAVYITFPAGSSHDRAVAASQ